MDEVIYYQSLSLIIRPKCSWLVECLPSIAESPGFNSQNHIKPGMVVSAFNPGSGKGEGEKLDVQGPPQLNTYIKASLSYTTTC